MATAKTAVQDEKSATTSTSPVPLEQYFAGTGVLDIEKQPRMVQVRTIREIVKGITYVIPSLGTVSLYQHMGYKSGETPVAILGAGLEWSDDVVCVTQFRESWDNRWNDFKNGDLHIVLRRMLLRKDGVIVLVEGKRKVWRHEFTEEVLSKADGGQIGRDVISVLSDNDMLRIIIDRRSVPNFLCDLLKTHASRLSRIRNEERDLLHSRSFVTSVCIRAGVTLLV